MGAIRQSAHVHTDTFTTHMIRVTIPQEVAPVVSRDDIVFVEVMIGTSDMPIVKKIRLNNRDMDRLCPMDFTIRDY